jgi:predicted RNA-binding Zn-ribbon protein involved in translation (DUF1610 family)
MRNCYFCKSEILSCDSSGKTTYDETAGPKQIFDCPQCGKFIIYSNWVRDIEPYKDIVAGYLLETKKNRESFLEIDGPMVDSIKNSPLIPRDSSSKILKLLLFLDKNCGYFGEPIPVPIASIYSSNITEREKILTTLRSERYIETNGSIAIRPYASLTMKGLEYIKVHKNIEKTDQCFVARWFNPTMDNLLKTIILPGCRDAGYDPKCVNDKDFNGDIVDEIIAGIKESQFIVVDLTGYRGGVYYEAGFAAGLGKQVILMCREDYLDGDPNENRRVHFDLSHSNIIVWSEGGEGKARMALTNRIRATIGLGSFKKKT